MTRRIAGFRFGYTRSPAITGNRRVLVASSNGLLYAFSVTGRLTQVSTSATLASNRYLQGVQYGADQFIIADNSPNLASHASDGVRGSGNDRFDAASQSDWTTLGIDTDDYVLVIEQATGDLINGVYAISSVASGELTTSTNVATGASGSCKWRITRSSKVYDHGSGTLVRFDATSGNEPVACSMVCQFLNAIWWAGDPDNPHVWYKSEQGDAYNYDYTAEGAGVAVAGTSSTDGSPGEPITALVPVGNDYLIIACRTKLFVMRGDPSAGGSFANLSQTVGIVAPDAWCLGRGGELFFLSASGVWMLPSGATTHPQPLTKDKLPRELNGIPNDVHATMAYDPGDNGVWLFLESDSLGSSAFRNWWIDAESGAHFPTVLPTASVPVRAFLLDGQVLTGCKDGYLRVFDYFAETDDGTAITSYALLGPFMLGDGALVDGILNELHAAIADDGGSVTWELYTGDTAEDATDAAISNTGSVASGTFTAGRNNTERPRSRAVAAVLRLEGTGTRRWGVEWIKAVRAIAGPHMQR